MRCPQTRFRGRGELQVFAPTPTPTTTMLLSFPRAVRLQLCPERQLRGSRGRLFCSLARRRRLDELDCGKCAYSRDEPTRLNNDLYFLKLFRRQYRNERIVVGRYDLAALHLQSANLDDCLSNRYRT